MLLYQLKSERPSPRRFPVTIDSFVASLRPTKFSQENRDDLLQTPQELLGPQFHSRLGIVCHFLGSGNRTRERETIAKCKLRGSSIGDGDATDGSLL